MDNELCYLAGLLLARERSTSELADLLHLKPAEVIGHLAMLRKLGLVTARTCDQITYYVFDKKALYSINREVMSANPPPTPVDDYPDEEERKMLKNWFNGDQLVIIPEGNKRLEVLLKWLATYFEVGREYSEKEVNTIIKRHHDDTATLRRSLIDYGFMQRDHGIYWRV
jgi:hypothetical protein